MYKEVDLQHDSNSHSYAYIKTAEQERVSEGLAGCTATAVFLEWQLSNFRPAVGR
jgi:hypothetical protein